MHNSADFHPKTVKTLYDCLRFHATKPVDERVEFDAGACENV